MKDLHWLHFLPFFLWLRNLLENFTFLFGSLNIYWVCFCSRYRIEINFTLFLRVFAFYKETKIYDLEVFFFKFIFWEFFSFFRFFAVYAQGKKAIPANCIGYVLAEIYVDIYWGPLYWIYRVFGKGLWQSLLNSRICWNFRLKQKKTRDLNRKNWE